VGVRSIMCSESQSALVLSGPILGSLSSSCLSVVFLSVLQLELYTGCYYLAINKRMTAMTMGEVKFR